MNKQAFLNELEQILQGLSPEERKDIMRDMEEYFREATSHGRSEEETVKKLGSPKEFSETILAEAKVKRIQTAPTVSKKISAVFGALGAILVLTPFNFFFVLIPMLLVTFFFVLGWGLMLMGFLSLPVLIIVSIFLIIDVGFKLFALLSILFFVIGWFGLIGAIFIALTYLTLFFFKGIATLFQWNVSFVKNRMRGE